MTFSILSSKRTFYFIFVIFLITTLYVVLAAGRDFYKILGVRKGAGDKEIKKAFRKLSMKYHPDQNPTEAAKSKYIEINNAYDILTNAEKRKIYDQYGEDGLNQSSQGGHPGGNPFGGGSGGFHFGGNSGGADFFQQFFGQGGGPFGQQQQRRQQPQQPAQPLYEKDPYVLELNDSSWPFFRTESTEEKEQIWFIKFYSGSCGPCHQVAPAWKEAAKELKGLVKVAAIDCVQSQRVCQQAGIDSYPSFLLYPFNSRQPITFPQNRRSKEDFVQFAHNNLPVFISTTTPSQMVDIINSGQYLPTVIILAPAGRTPLISPTLQTLAKQFRKFFKFVAIAVPAASNIELDHLYEILNRDAISPIKPLKNEPNSLTSALFFIKTPYQTIPYTGPASFKQLSSTLTEYKNNFTEKGFYSQDFSKFMMQNRGTPMTQTLLSTYTAAPTAQYQNIIFTCPFVAQDLTSFDGFNPQKPTHSKFSELHPLYTLPDASVASASLQYTPNQFNAVLFEMMQTLDNKVHLVDINDVKTVQLFKQIIGAASFDADVIGVQSMCNNAFLRPRDVITNWSVASKSIPMFIVGLNMKRNRYTMHSATTIYTNLKEQDDHATGEMDISSFLNGVDNFMTSNESSPQGAKPVAKRIKVALGLETEHDEL